MTTPAIGSVSQRIPQVQGFTVSTSVVNPNVTIIEAISPPSPAPTPPIYIATDGVAVSLDNPGMTSFPAKVQFIQGQGEAVKSAARNTALAFGLNTTTAADQAFKFSNAILLADLNNVPDVVSSTTVIVIPD